MTDFPSEKGRRVLRPRSHGGRHVPGTPVPCRPDLDMLTLGLQHLRDNSPWDIELYPGPDTNCPTCGTLLLAGIRHGHSTKTEDSDLWVCSMCADGYHLAYGP